MGFVDRVVIKTPLLLLDSFVDVVLVRTLLRNRNNILILFAHLFLPHLVGSKFVSVFVQGFNHGVAVVSYFGELMSRHRLVEIDINIVSSVPSDQFFECFW